MKKMLGVFSSAPFYPSIYLSNINIYRNIQVGNVCTVLMYSPPHLRATCPTYGTNPRPPNFSFEFPCPNLALMQLFNHCWINQKMMPSKTIKLENHVFIEMFLSPTFPMIGMTPSAPPQVCSHGYMNGSHKSKTFSLSLSLKTYIYLHIYGIYFAYGPYTKSSTPFIGAHLGA